VTRPRAVRLEAFGAIVQLERPRALVFVDRDYARGLGHDGGALWSRPGDDSELLFTLTTAVSPDAPVQAMASLGRTRK